MKNVKKIKKNAKKCETCENMLKKCEKMWCGHSMGETLNKVVSGIFIFHSVDSKTENLPAERPLQAQHPKLGQKYEHIDAPWDKYVMGLFLRFFSYIQ